MTGDHDAARMTGGPTPRTAGGTGRRIGARPASGIAWEPAWTWGPPERQPRSLWSRPGPYHPVPAWVTRLTSYPDDRTPRVVVSSYAGTRVVLDLRDGRVIGAPDERPNASVCAPVRIDGERMIVSGGGAGHLQLSDLASGRPRWRRWCGDIRSLATATLAGRPVAVLAGSAPQLQIWSLAANRGDRLAVVRAGTGRVAALAATNLGDDVVVALGGTTGRITLWRLSVTNGTGSGVRIASLGEYGFEAPGLVSTLEFVWWQGRPVLLGAAGRLARAWEAAGGSPLGPSFAGHGGAVNAVAVGRYGARPVVWSSDDATVRAWLPETGGQVGEAFHYPYEAALTSMTVAEIDGGPMLVSGDAAGLVWVWDPERPYPFHRAGSRRIGSGLAGVGPAGCGAAGCGTADPASDVAASGPESDPAAPGGDRVRLAGTTRDGRPVVLAGGADGVVRGFAGPDGAEVPVPEPTAPVPETTAWRDGVRRAPASVAGLPDAPVLVPGSHPTLARVTPDGVDLWDPATGEYLGLVGPLPTGTPASAGRLGPMASTRVDGVWTLLFAAGSTVHRADIAAGTPVVAWHGHTRPVHAIATAELDGVPVGLTAAGDDTVRLWDLRSGRGLGVVLAGHGGAAYAVAGATVDGRALVFGAGRSGLVRGVDVTELLRTDPPPAAGPDGTGGGGADTSWAESPEPTLMLTATGPVRSLAVVRSGWDSWLVVADGALLLWCPVVDDRQPRWTSELGAPVTGLVALPGLLVAAAGDGLVAYRPAARP